MALGAAGRSAYGASKAALSSLTNTWSPELAPQRITVNAIAPGPIEIGMFRVLNPRGSIGEAELLRNIPIGHFGVIDEVTGMAAYILDPTNEYLTGQVIYLDGGVVGLAASSGIRRRTRRGARAAGFGDLTSRSCLCVPRCVLKARKGRCRTGP